MYYVLQSCTMLVSHVVVMLAIAVSHQRTSLTVSLHGGCDWPDPVLDMIGFGLCIYIAFSFQPRELRAPDFARPPIASESFAILLRSFLFAELL